MIGSRTRSRIDVPVERVAVEVQVTRHARETRRAELADHARSDRGDREEHLTDHAVRVAGIRIETAHREVAAGRTAGRVVGVGLVVVDEDRRRICSAHVLDQGAHRLGRDRHLTRLFVEFQVAEQRVGQRGERAEQNRERHE